MLHLVLIEDLYFLQDGGLIWPSQSQLLPRSLLPDCFGVLDWHFKMSLRETVIRWFILSENQEITGYSALKHAITSSANLAQLAH